VDHSQVSRFPFFGSVFLFGAFVQCCLVMMLQTVLFGKQMLVLSVNSSVLWNIVLISVWVCVMACAHFFFHCGPPI